jgi:hypothetical protein
VDQETTVLRVVMGDRPAPRGRQKKKKSKGKRRG